MYSYRKSIIKSSFDFHLFYSGLASFTHKRDCLMTKAESVQQKVTAVMSLVNPGSPVTGKSLTIEERENELSMNLDPETGWNLILRVMKSYTLLMAS